MKSDHFCFMPWHGLAIAANGTVKPCCQYSTGIDHISAGNDVAKSFNNEHMQQLRTQFLNGEKPQGCKSCWQREDQIGTSRRVWFANKFGSNIPKEYNYQANVTDPLWIQADINLSNVCNLKCRMCGSWASNQWFDEELRLAAAGVRFQKNSVPMPLIQHDLETLKSILPHVKHMQRIDFKGGEPMLAKHHNEFLDWLIAKGYNKSITLQYTTNGTVINPNILDRLSKFKNVRIMFSIEGTGSLYQYIRGGKHSLEEVTRNILMYDTLDNIHIGFNVTLQAYNLLNLADLHAYLYQLPLVHGSANEAFNTICNNPDYLSPHVLPDVIRDIALERIQGIIDFNHLSTSLQARVWDPIKWQTFVDFTNYLDSWRMECITDHIPELSRIWSV